MKNRDEHGRFVKQLGDPFREGRMVDRKMHQLSLSTLKALNLAVAQAESDAKGK